MCCVLATPALSIHCVLIIASSEKNRNSQSLNYAIETQPTVFEISADVSLLSRGHYVLVRACLPGLYQKYTKIILRLKLEGFFYITERILDKGCQ